MVDTDRIVETSFELLVVYYDEASRLLFISCTSTIDGFYEAISTAVGADSSELPTSLVRRVVKKSQPARVQSGDAKYPGNQQSRIVPD